MAHIRTVKYTRVRCRVCDLNILQRWNNVLREDHSEVPEETGSAVGDHVHKEVRKPLEEFDPYTSVFYCPGCNSILHHSVIKNVDEPEHAKEITLVWAADQLPASV